jgi:hypothetical protein
MGWNTAHPPRNDKYCDLEGCTRTNEVGFILICGHSYHFECLLFRLGSQCKYCKDYLMSGIEKNCKAFDESVSSVETATKVADENNSNVFETTETTENTSAEVDNVVLNSNIDQLYSDAMNNFRAALNN